LITDYGADAISVAEGNVERSQWAKGKSDTESRSQFGGLPVMRFGLLGLI